MSEVEEEPEEEPEGSGCAGVVVVTAAVLALLSGLYAMAPDAFVIGAWVIGWGALIVAAKRVPPAPNPAPPPAPERVSEEEPQVSLVRDKSHTNRWIVLRPSHWMSYDNDKRGES